MKQHLKYFCAAVLLLLCSRSSAQKLVSVYNGESEISAPSSVTLTDGFYVPAGSTLRIFTTGISYLNCVPLSSTPTTSQNFILTRSFRQRGVTDATLGASRSVCQENQAIQYFDGLGRPLQTVQVQGSPGFKDIVQPIAYDAFGREQFKYQPYAAQTGATGSFRDAAIGAQFDFFHLPQAAGVKATDYAFAETQFEASPLNRVLQQGALGEAWQINGGHTQRTEYGTNAQDEVKLWTVNNAGNGAFADVYFPGKLYKTTSRNENWVPADQKAGITEEFKDFEGRVVLKRVWETNGKYLSTYYVYDDLGNLRYVLPPAVNEHTDRLPAAISSFDETQAVFDQFIYGYRYDGRKRLVEKKIPGKGWEFMVYNKLDQVVLNQDAVQRGKSPQEWLYSKYDGFGRVVATGLYAQAGTTADNGTVPQRGAKDALQSGLDNQAEQIANGDTSISLWETRNGGDYDSKSFPQSGGDVLTVNYYDDYGFTGNSFGPPTGDQAPVARTKSLLTGTKVKNLSTGTMLLTVNYYDLEGRVVQSKSTNHLNGTDVVDNNWNFDGSLEKSKRTHKVGGVETIIANRYEYDHMGRKIAAFENINNQGEVGLNHLEYNEIGQLNKKSLHNDTQTTTLAYNERGWLKNSISDQFSIQLDYQENGGGQYNGNISRQFWSQNALPSSSPNVFSYGYDKLNRLTSGTSTGIYMSEVLNYDNMGNINQLGRNGGAMDQYYYNGNRLDRVDNVAGTYAYDANGNATVDGRTGMSLSYNLLNLPSGASGSGKVLSYVYDADGGKLRKTVTENGLTTVREYIDGIEYDGNNIDIIHTEEGVAQRNGANSYSYHYNLTDHLGNVRYTFDVYDGLIRPLQVDNYYPFGMRNSLAFGNNKYLYNGKEVQDELGGQLDYGARFYDPVIGRFSSIDPVAEHFVWMTNYQYGSNNPTSKIDLDGLEGVFFFELPYAFGNSNLVPKVASTAEVAAKFSENLAKAGAEIAGESIKSPQEHHIAPTQWKFLEFVQRAIKGGFKFEGKENKITLEKYSKLTGEGEHANHPTWNETMGRYIKELAEENKTATPEEAAELLRGLVKEGRDLINNNRGTKINDLFKKNTQDGTKVVLPPVPQPVKRSNDLPPPVLPEKLRPKKGKG
ncbi:RHS repeat-associated protein [Pedobacter sp. AK013]|uniref:DUF6443 domain-containing protein n=1 Tax=Pedobacter sp. AK013 TaxID=2723071 RepID=UPI001611D1DA|nr:DUF6443 domain-containing protein [Pedobacter sp. AK013]MBB6238787.1 RHS repeat-associated protein [Pedobacter sp. AK013]